MTTTPLPAAAGPRVVHFEIPLAAAVSAAALAYVGLSWVAFSAGILICRVLAVLP
jgi:hypothetical protein